MNMEKIYEYQDKIQQDLSFEEISRLYREILYEKYKELTDSDAIHCYQLLRGLINIFTQMIEGRKFDKGYLKDTIKWDI